MDGAVAAHFKPVERRDHCQNTTAGSYRRIPAPNMFADPNALLPGLVGGSLMTSLDAIKQRRITTAEREFATRGRRSDWLFMV